MKNKTRSELRNIIITALYQVEIFNAEKMEYNYEEIIKDLIEIENEFVNSCINGIVKNIERIDLLANKYMTDWTMDRIGKIDRSILRLGIYELLYTETPPIVAIDEAVELSKKYSDDKVVGLINSVMDKVYHEEKENGW